MDMVSHIVFDSDSGEVLHVHTEPAELRSTRDEVLQHAGPVEHRKLDVLRLAGAPPTGPFRIEKGKVLEKEEGTGAGGGVANAEFRDADFKRRYEHRS